MTPTFIDAARVEALTPFGPLIDHLEAEHRKPMPDCEEVLMQAPGTDGPPNAFLSLPAWRPGEALGIKVVTVFPQNEERDDGLPTIHAVYQLFDGETGVPTALIDGTMMTLRKTAADSGLGTRLLAGPAPERLLMVGAGSLCPHLVAAHRAARPSIARVSIWNRTPARAEAQAARIGAATDIPVAATEDLEAAAREADVICCATMATAPLIRGDWLKPGAHLDLVGGYTPEMREADDDACRRAEVFVDSRRFTIGNVGDITQPMASGALSEADIRADLFDLASGRHPGRSGEDAVTLFKNAGGGHLDLMTALFIAGRAEGRP